MNNIVVVEKKSANSSLTRIIDKFEVSNPIKQGYTGVIKNYIYLEQKRILA